MPESTKSFLFPDINVWVALTYEGHVHHASARRWFASLTRAVRLYFCRFTQLGLLRLLTAEAVMGRDEALTQEEAWRAYDRWLQDERVGFLDEPSGIESAFRSLTRSRRSAPKEWADAYLAAFAASARLTLVTFDRALQNKIKQHVLLRA